MLLQLVEASSEVGISMAPKLPSLKIKIGVFSKDIKIVFVLFQLNGLGFSVWLQNGPFKNYYMIDLCDYGNCLYSTKIKHAIIEFEESSNGNWELRLISKR